MSERQNSLDSWEKVECDGENPTNGAVTSIEPSVALTTGGPETTPSDYVQELTSSDVKDEEDVVKAGENDSVLKACEKELLQDDKKEKPVLEATAISSTGGSTIPQQYQKELEEPQIQASTAATTGGNTIPQQYQKELEEPQIQASTAAPTGGNTIPQQYQKELEEPQIQASTVAPTGEAEESGKEKLPAVKSQNVGDKTIPPEYKEFIEKTEADTLKTKTTSPDDDVIKPGITVAMTGSQGNTLPGEYRKELEEDDNLVTATAVPKVGGDNTVPSEYKDNLEKGLETNRGEREIVIEKVSDLTIDSDSQEESITTVLPTGSDKTLPPKYREKLEDASEVGGSTIPSDYRDKLLQGEEVMKLEEAKQLGSAAKPSEAERTASRKPHFFVALFMIVGIVSGVFINYHINDLKADYEIQAIELNKYIAKLHNDISSVELLVQKQERQLKKELEMRSALEGNQEKSMEKMLWAIEEVVNNEMESLQEVIDKHQEGYQDSLRKVKQSMEKNGLREKAKLEELIAKRDRAEADDKKQEVSDIQEINEWWEEAENKMKAMKSGQENEKNRISLEYELQKYKATQCRTKCPGMVDRHHSDVIVQQTIIENLRKEENKEMHMRKMNYEGRLRAMTDWQESLEEIIDVLTSKRENLKRQ